MRLVIGSWKIIEIWLPRTLRICSSGNFRSSRPSSRTSPVTRLLAAANKPMIDSAVTLLPEPDSPTMATVSRGPISNEIPFTTVVQTPSTRNAVVRLRTASTGPVVMLRP